MFANVISKISNKLIPQTFEDSKKSVTSMVVEYSEMLVVVLGSSIFLGRRLGAEGLWMHTVSIQIKMSI